MRVKNDYVHHQKISVSMGVKICAPGLEDIATMLPRSGRTITHQKSQTWQFTGKCNWPAIGQCQYKSTGQVTILWKYHSTLKLCWKVPLNIHWNMPLKIHDDFRGVNFWCAIFCPYTAAQGNHVRPISLLTLWISGGLTQAIMLFLRGG